MKLSVTVVLALLFLSSVNHEARGRNETIRSVEAEDLELEMQLKIMNKPPIKSFKKNGRIIDCIDIYKQPAFDHPLLKNHTIQLRPSFLPEGVKSRREDASKQTGQFEESAISSCPSGTVPFKRVVKEDLIRAKRALDLLRPQDDIIPPEDQIHYAAVSTPYQAFYGVKSRISLYNLTGVVAPQISEVMLWLGSGTQGPYNSIEFGWTVNPQLYGDTRTHRYSLWTTDGFQKTGCYDALCPGYIQVSKQIIMGDVLSPVTFPGEAVYFMTISLFRDPNTGHWWLYANDPDGDKPIGYWPKELLPKMADSAAVVQLGGKVFTPPEMKFPPMGSGFFIGGQKKDFMRTCFIDNIEFVNSDLKYYKPDISQMMLELSDVHKYQAYYLDDWEDRGCTIIFGGTHLEE